MKKAFVYILKCSDDSYYIGHTENIEKRLQEHSTKIDKNCYIANRLPIQLLYVKEFETRNEAFIFERKIKKWNRAKKEALMSGNIQSLKKLSKKNLLNDIILVIPSTPRRGYRGKKKNFLLINDNQITKSYTISKI